MKNTDVNFGFSVNYICLCCVDCPDFKEFDGINPYCDNDYASFKLSEEGLDCTCYEFIHHDCPRRGTDLDG